MTDKELRKLSRAELLELLLIQTREIDRLNAQLEQLEAENQQRKIKLNQAGNIAEAALQLNRVFEAAQAAADQYLESIMDPDDIQKQSLNMLQETRQQCDAMLEETHQKANEVWQIIRQELFNPQLDYAQWQKIASFIDTQLKQD